MSEIQSVQVPSYRDRIDAREFEAQELAIICGALNQCSGMIAALTTATPTTVQCFTYEQAKQALRVVRQRTTGDALDNLDDVVLHIADVQRTLH